MSDVNAINDEKAPVGEPGTAEILAALGDIRSEIESLRRLQQANRKADSLWQTVYSDPGLVEVSLATSAVAAVLITAAGVTLADRIVVFMAVAAFLLSAVSGLMFWLRSITGGIRALLRLEGRDLTALFLLTPWFLMLFALLALFIAAALWTFGRPAQSVGDSFRAVSLVTGISILVIFVLALTAWSYYSSSIGSILRERFEDREPD